MEININNIIKAAQVGGEVHLKYFGKNLEVETKSLEADVFTKADTESEEVIINHLERHFPDFSILSEEAGFIDKKSEYTFIIDPLDGSNNFVTGLPIFTTNIALQKNNTTIAGIINNGFLKQVCYAQKGKGAYINGKKILVDKEVDIKKANVGFMRNYLHGWEYYIDLRTELRKKEVKRIVTSFCPGVDYTLLASGKIHAIINRGTEIYDYLAGRHIAEEAGANIFDFQGNKDPSEDETWFVIASSEEIQHELQEIVQKIPPRDDRAMQLNTKKPNS